MAIKAPQKAFDVRKEVGEIDTSAPFQSVRAAVNLFGEVAFSAARTFSPKTERSLGSETELQLAQNELNKYKEQMRKSETTRGQALTELDLAKRTVEDLDQKLNTIKKSKELTKTQTKQLKEVGSVNHNGKDDAWKHEMDNMTKQYAVAIAELDVAKQELSRIKKDFDASLEAKVAAIQQEVEAKGLSDVNEEKASQFSHEIAATQESLKQAKLALLRTQQEESKVLSEKNGSRQSYRHKLEETEKKLSALKKEFDPQVYLNLQTKLNEENAEIGATQRQIKHAKDSELESATNVTKELDEAKGVLKRVAEEESSLRSLVDSLKLELEALKKEHAQVKEKDAETESIAAQLHAKLHYSKFELEAAMVVQSKASSAHEDLMATFKQLSTESENARMEAEELTSNVSELRNEADASQALLNEMEKKLEVALKDAEAAKEAEVKAANQIKILSDKANDARSSTAESCSSISISREEYNSLSQKVEACEKVAEMKVAAAMAQVEAIRASENSAIKKLEAARKKMEEIEMATDEALRRAETAEAAKKMVQGELRRWREKEQKKAADTASMILVQTPMPAGPSSSRKKMQRPKSVGDAKEIQTTEKNSMPKKKLIPSFSSLLNRKKGQVDNEFASYLPGEKQE
ncbi:putative WEB family protein [Dioscorea sansibarensis]